MALTEHIKHATRDVTTGAAAHVYYTEAEWADVETARLNNELPKAQATAKARLSAQTQAEVDAVIQPPELNQGLARMNELLMNRILNGSWTIGEQAEVDSYQATLDATRAIRIREATALAAVDAAVSVFEVEAVVL